MQIQRNHTRVLFNWKPRDERVKQIPSTGTCTRVNFTGRNGAFRRRGKETFCPAVVEKLGQIFPQVKRFYDMAARSRREERKRKRERGSHESVTNKVNIEIKVGRLGICRLFACFRNRSEENVARDGTRLNVIDLPGKK